jgi:hypothetical protein
MSSTLGIPVTLDQPELSEQERIILEYVWRGYWTGMIASALGTNTDDAGCIAAGAAGDIELNGYFQARVS